MGIIKINLINSLEFYDKCLVGNGNEATFRYELMHPMKTMWDYLNVPLKATQSGAEQIRRTMDICVKVRVLRIGYLSYKTIGFLEN